MEREPEKRPTNPIDIITSLDDYDPNVVLVPLQADEIERIMANGNTTLAHIMQSAVNSGLADDKYFEAVARSIVARADADPGAAVTVYSDLLNNEAYYVLPSPQQRPPEQEAA